MEFPSRNKIATYPALNSESGQGVVEYILVLVVTIGLVLGGVYQLNGAFKTWATNYFGNYLACLLETGELPSAGGGGGGANSSSCQSMYEEFSLEKGRPMKLSGATGGGGSGGPGGSRGAAGATGGGDRETQRHGSSGSAGNYSPIRGFGKGGSGRNASTSNKSKLKGEEGGNTGDTSAKGYGNAYSATNKKIKTGVKHRLDNGFAFQRPDEDKVRRQVASGMRKDKDEAGRKGRLSMNNKVFKKTHEQEESNSISFGSFIKILIIAAILIALFMFLGGQALQIGKSME